MATKQRQLFSLSFNENSVSHNELDLSIN